METTGYYINENSEFVIENYNRAKPFASFLPAIAGLNGKPMWLYYVNRGQCVSTFGINNKDNAIMEFEPANKSYRQTSLQGFRTFLRIRDRADNRTVYYEPFQDNPQDHTCYDLTQKMIITSHDLKIEEENRTLGLKFDVMFCTLPGETFSGLIRCVNITNQSGKNLEIEMLDGMPAILPYYLENNDLKEMSNLRQAWMRVEHANTIPFYRIKALPYDTPETMLIEGGNFFLNIDFQGKETKISRTVVEPSVIFGNVTDFSYPANFMNGLSLPEEQPDMGFTPCAFGYRHTAIGCGETDSTYTLIGNIEKYEKLERFIKEKLTRNYLDGKIEENKTLIQKLKDPIFTLSNSKEFNLYCGQTFLDNVLRGGYPVQLSDKHCFYVFSRKHGDLEREYNFFQVDSSYYSQGNSNFRDVNQNRRNDIFFFPFTAAANIHTFFDLIQLDGFNPLVVKGAQFLLQNTESVENYIVSYIEKGSREKIQEFLKKPFTPGSFLDYMEQNSIVPVNGSANDFLEKILNECKKEDLADFSDGYWVDHWTYNTDLLEQFIEIYPDKVSELFFGDKSFSFYESDEIVLPRSEKYVLTNSGVRQFHSVKKSSARQELIASRKSCPHKTRTNSGKGDIYYCTLATKITVLLVNKIASLDPEGVGIEMESNKPGWCDALNGLPGILGSSINESAETGRLAAIFLKVLSNFASDSETVLLPEEAACFYAEIQELFRKLIGDYAYWDQSCDAKERYRQKIILGVTGKETAIRVSDLKLFLRGVIEKVNRGIPKAVDPNTGVYATYFINEVTEYKILPGSSLPCVQALAFKQRPLPLFLEGPVHVLRMEKSKPLARSLYQSIRKTDLYDAALDMYKICGNVMEETSEIGRQNVFPRGWLENEAIFLHMEYKYFLELLRCGAYEEFFHCMKTAFIPFLNPETYGRSILENSSFLASSVYPNKKLHGNGFVSRLTGASAEFLNMWRIMTTGQAPFFLNEEGELTLKFEPVLPGWLFLAEEKTAEILIDTKPVFMTFPANTFAFKLFGKTLIVYYNESRKNTFGAEGVKVQRAELLDSNAIVNINGCVISNSYAQKIRRGEYKQINLYLS